MKKALLIGLFIGLGLAGCLPKDPAPNEDVNALYQRFHGKYKPVSSVASEPIDVNLDGKASDDMFQEYGHLEQHDLRIDILGPNKYRSTNGFYFLQLWPEQYVRTSSGTKWQGDIIDYDPRYYANFARQGGTGQFTFSSDLQQIFVQPNQTQQSFRWQSPQSVTVQGNGYLRVVNKRRLFTTTGVKDVIITTLYERYTMAT